jgi:putative oxidoreductase
MMTDEALLLARCLLMATYGASLIDKLRAPPAELDQIRSLGLPWPLLMERLAGLFELVCIVLVVAGYQARWAAAALLVFTLFLTFALLRYWTMPPSPETVLNRTLFYNNLSVCGGLALLIACGPGAYALGG